MKKLFNEKSLIIIFLLLNLCAISVAIILTSRIILLEPANIAESRSRISVSTLPEFAKLVNVNSRAFIIYDSVSRSVVTGKNEHLRFAPASTAKIVSAVVALEYYGLDHVLTASGVDAFEGSKMKLAEGEQITVRNLLYGMMLPSGNDAARVLANNYPGGFKEFVNAMNEKARQLQMINTKFVDPDGYDDANFTTAYDLARVGSYAMNNPTFRKIVGTKQITVADISGKYVHELYNLNELLGVDNITGIKTGFTDEAGGVLVTSVEQGNRRYIVVVLNSVDRFADTVSVVEGALQKIKLFSY